MTTDQAVDAPEFEPIEATPDVLTVEFAPIQVPDVVMIDGLRQQVSVLNDEVVRLRIDLDFKNQLVSDLQRVLVSPEPHSHDGVVHVHEEFDA